MTTDPQTAALRCMVRGAYDLQMLRMQTGLRLCANFRSKLGLVDPETKEDEEAAAEKIIDRLRASYRTLTEGVARNRTLPAREGFKGDELISDYSELVLTNQFIEIESREKAQFRQLTLLLDDIPIYINYLRDVRGVGPAMAAVLITGFNPHRARHVSSFWKYGGLDVAADNRGRSRRAEHLVQREYTTRDGEVATRNSVTYNPFVKNKLLGVLAGSFLRSASPWRQVYDDYKHRLESDPRREKCTSIEWKRRRKAGEDVNHLWTPGRINNASKRYMVKMFLAELWVKWRELEGLPVTLPYAQAKLGQPPHAA